MNLKFLFQSSDHLRYENGIHVSGPHPGGAARAIAVEPNITGGSGFSVTIYSVNGGNASVQMGAKQMKIIESDNNKIVLQGFGNDDMGFSFSDYGLTINLKNEKILSCVLHMLDRKVDIEYKI